MRKKSFLLFVILCCITLLVACVFVACNPGSSSQEGGDNSQQPGDDAVYCTVTFNVNGGDSEIEPKDYAVGYVMNLPTPTRDGYTFVGWADIDGTSYTNASVMPNKDLTLYAQWQIIVSSYEDDYVYFKPATQGVKDSDTRYEYSGMTSYVYVELTSADLGGRTQVGKENNFDFVSGVSMEYSVKDGYTLQWYRDYDFSVANGAQRFTLNYGSNFQFLTVSTNQKVVATYLVDFYVLRDYAINLYSNIYAEKPYTTTYVVENRTLSADTTPYQLKDFVFDKRVYWNAAAGNGWGDWVAFNYGTRITKDWDLYQTYKPVTMTADLDGGTLEGELTVTPYTEYQQLPVPVKEGYDFIGWQLPDAQNSKENYFTDINGFNATQLLGAGGGVNGDVYFKTLKAVWSPKQYYKVTEGDTVTFKEMVPVATYTDKSLTEINEIIYVLHGTDCIVPTKVVYDGAFEFFGWNSYKTDNNGDIYGSPFNFNIKVTEPIAIYQDMGSLRDGTTLTALGLYLNGTRTFTSIGTAQRIKAWLPAKATYSFTVTTDNYVNFSCDSSSYNVTSSSSRTITVSCTSSLGQAVYFDVSSYSGSFSIEFSGPTGTTEGNPVQISSENLVSPGDGVSITATTKAGYTFIGWYSGDEKVAETLTYEFVMSAGNVTYTAKWIKVSVESEDTRKGTVSKLTGTYFPGDEASITAMPKAGYTFIGWYDGDTKVSESGSYDYTFTMPAEPKTYTAKWIEFPVEIIVSEEGFGTAVGGATGSVVGGETTVTAQAATLYVFAGWYNSDGELLCADAEYTFVLGQEPVSLIAKFELATESESDDFVFSLNSSEDGYILTSYNGEDTSVVIPSSYNGLPVVEIGSNAFQNDAFIEGVYVSDSVTKVGSYAFSGCSGLTVAVLENSVTSIGDAAFSGCSSLEEITIPFVGAESGKTSSDAYQYPFGYIFGTSSYTGGKATEQYYYGSSSLSTTSTTYYIPSSLRSVTVTGGNILYGAFYNCSGLTSVTIGDSVTSIGYRAFYNCSGLTSITIGNGVTSIGSSAFEGCSRLTSIVIPDSVTSIGNSAFEGCSRLTSITIPDSVTSIGSSAFRNCSGLTSITIPDSVTSIGSSAFRDCSGLTSVTIGNGVTSIGNSAFEGCSRLTSIVIPDSVTSIGYRAFYGCKGLTTITIPDSVTSIGSSAFSGCRSLEEITIPFVGAKSDKTSSDTYQYPFGYIFGTSSYTGGAAVTQRYYGSSTSSTISTTYYIPSSLRSVTATGGNILYGAFYDCSMLTSVTIGNGVTSIGDRAFYDCSGLTSVTIGNGVTNIGEQAFYNCSDITSVTIGNGVTSIGDRAFYNCSGLTSITIPDSVTSIGSGAFYECSGLTSVTVGNGVTSIGSYAFSGCSGLTSITIPDSVTSIGSDAFYGTAWYNSQPNGVVYAGKVAYGYKGTMPSNTSVVLEEGTLGIADYAFSGCSGLVSITIPDSVTSIGSSAFYDCSGLTSITIPDSVESIEYQAFYNCSGLTSVTIGNGVTSIGDRAFYGCSGLTSVTIGNGVTSIGDDAFRNCSGLTSITIGNGVTSIGSDAFYGTAWYNSQTNGVIYAGKVVYKYKGTMPSNTSIVLQEGTLGIADYAFWDCSGLVSITIPDSVTSIGSGAFYECSGLVSITIPDSVTSIGSSAFRDCSGLTSITIPDSVTSIGMYAFEGCSGLTSINIPNSVKSIGNAAFKGCSGLTSITVTDGNPKYHSAGNCLIETATKTLIAGCKTSIIPDDDSVTSIGNHAFYNCSGLTSITIPNGVTSIGSGAFYGCSGLTSITIPDSVTSIGSDAFYNCSGLTSVTIGNSVTSIGSSAFSGCSGLTSITIPDSVTSIGGSAFSGCSGLTSVKFMFSFGWQVSSSSDFGSYTGLSSSDLSNRSTAANYLKSTYCYRYWRRV